MRSLWFIYLIVPLLFISGCGAGSGEDIWKSPEKRVGPWIVQVNAVLRTGFKEQSLVYKPKVTNLSNQTIDGVSIKVVYPQNWPLPQSTAQYAGRDDFKAEEAKELTFSDSYNLPNPTGIKITQDKLKSIKIVIQWEDKSQFSKSNSATISFDNNDSETSTAYIASNTELYDKPMGKVVRNDLTPGRVVTLLDRDGSWAKILIYTYDTPDDNIGWVKRSAIAYSPEGLTLIEGRVKKIQPLYDGPPPNGKRMSEAVNFGQHLRIEKRQDGWVYGVFPGGLYGWLPETEIEFVGPTRN